MRMALYLCIILLLPQLTQAAPLKVMSYNIRCGLCEAEGTAQYWPERKFLLAHLIQTQQPDLIGVQEAELFQLQDLAAMLPQYQWYGKGRDDGQNKGETSAVLYRKDKLQLLSASTLWLSETPQKPSRGWDAALNRTLAYTEFQHKESGQRFYFLNTHFDHHGEQAQLQSARLIKTKLQQLAPQSNVILTGDLNTEPGSAPYQVLAEVLQDAALVAKQQPAASPATFNGFGRPGVVAKTIDFIFVSSKLQVQSYRVDNRRYNGLYPSDHEALLALIELN